jgi:Extensin-like protein C-terminus
MGAPLSLAPPGAPYTSGGRAYAPSGEPPVATAPAIAAPAVVPLGRSVAPMLSIAPAALAPTATLACPVVSVLNRFVSDRVQPAAARWFGQPVVEIKQISAYSCRGMNGNPRASISEHAFGNALDIAAFTLADGRKVTVKDGWHGTPDEQGFLHDVQGAACEMFTTILAPGSNAYHYDHMHVDLMRHASGRVICEPDPISGEVAAARAGGRYGFRNTASSVTGSIFGRR